MRNNGLRNSMPSLAILLAISVLAGCASVKIPPVKTYDQAKKEVEAMPPLVSPKVEKREGYKDGNSQAVVKGTVAPYSGLLLDEKRAKRLLAISAERNRRYTELEAARKKHAIQKLIYESALAHLRAKAAARSTWWEENKGLAGLAIGGTIGMAVIVGLVYALTGGNGINSSSVNTHLLLPVN